MKYLFVLFISFFLFLHSFAQNCVDTSYRKSYKTSNGSLLNFTYKALKNDYSLAVGKYINNATGNNSYYIIKLHPLGNVVWAMTVQPPAVHNGTVTVPNIIELSNGDIIISSTLNSNYLFLVKLSAAGNLIWQKTLSFTNDIFFSNPRLQEVDNELFISNTAYANEGPLVGEFLNCIIKLNADGNVLWCKYYSSQNCKSFLNLGLVKAGEGIISWGRIGNGYCLVSTGSNTELGWFSFKLNKVTGDIIASKLYENWRQTNNTVLGGYNYLFSSTQIDENEFGITNNFTNPMSNGQKICKIIFDSSLSIKKSFTYYTSNNLGAIRGQLDKEGNLNILLYSLAVNSNPNQYIAKINKENAVIRQKKLIAPPGSNAFYGGREPFDYKRNYTSLATNFKDVGNDFFQVTQLSNDEKNSNCFGFDTSFIEIDTFLLRPYQSDYITEVEDLNVVSTNINTATATLNIIKEDYCQLITNCNQIIVDKNIDTVCNTSQFYTFKAHIDVSCNKHVFWAIDSSAIDSLTIIDDTTMQVKFKKQWAGYVYGSINSCNLLKDSVYVNVFPSPGNINLGNDRAICSYDSLRLKAGIGFRNYEWQDGSSDSLFTVRQAGLYHVIATDYCNNIFFDSIRISVDYPTPLQLMNDSSICIGDSLTLDAGNNFSSYLWNTGLTTQSITIHHPGEYIVNAINSFGCSVADTFKLLNTYPLPNINLNKKEIFCIGQNDTLSVTENYQTYLWSNGSTTNKISISDTGWYKIKVSHLYGCFALDSVWVRQLILPSTIFLPTDKSICKGENFLIQPNQLFDNYLWNTGSTLPSLTINQSGNYSLFAIDFNGCNCEDSILITEISCPETIFFPNSFTPNNDGSNDLFKPTVSRPLAAYHFIVYNRYGQKVFETSNTQRGWDGTIKGFPQGTGAFIWLCSYQFPGKKLMMQKGHVLLLR